MTTLDDRTVDILDPADQHFLTHEAAISVDMLRDHGVYTATTTDQLPEELKSYGRRVLPAIVFWWTDSEGNRKPQIRPRLGESRNEPYKYTDSQGAEHVLKYISPKGSSILGHVRHVPDADTVLIVEGTKQSLAAASWAPAGVGVYAMAGCYNWRRDGVPMNALSVCRKKDVVIVLDGDAATNRNVFDAGIRLKEAIRNEGANTVTFTRLVASGTKGLDDVLATRAESDRTSYLMSLIGNTHSKPADKKPQPKAGKTGRMIDRNKIVVGATDAQLGDVFVAQYRDRLRYNASSSDWLAYEGGRWDEEGGLTYARQYAHQLRSKVQAVTYVADLDTGEPVARDATDWLEQHSRLAAVVGEAATRAGLIITRDQLDSIERTAYKFNVANGTVDLRTGDLMPHSPTDFITQRSDIEFDRSATAPKFQEFLSYIIPGAEMREFLGRLLGMAMIGDVTEHRLPVFLGAGRNGKGTLIRLVSSVFGSYYSGISKSLLIESRFEDHPTVVATLWRKRLVTTEELPKNARWNVSRAKELTGGDALTGRFMHGNEFTFRPQHSLILAANDWPEVDASEEAFWLRAMRIPFNRRIDKPDSAVETRIRDQEGPGILNWLLAGLRDYLNHGLGEPPDVVMATTATRVESSVIGRWISERITVTGRAEDSIAKQESHEAFLTWRRDHAPTYSIPSMHNFVKSVRELGVAGVGESKVRIRKNPDGSPCDRQVSVWTGVVWGGGDLEGDNTSQAPDSESIGTRHGDPLGDPLGDPFEVPSSQVGTLGTVGDPSVSSFTHRKTLSPIEREDSHREKRSAESVPEGPQDHSTAVLPAETLKTKGSPEGSQDGPHGPHKGSPRTVSPGQSVGDPSRYPVVTLDLETRSSDLRYHGEPRDFFRLAGYSHDDGAVEMTTDVELVAELCRQSTIVGHNIASFDLPVISRATGLDYLTMARRRQIVDTMVLAHLAYPPEHDESSHGTDKIMKSLGLDVLASRLIGRGKTDDLASLAAEFGGYDIPVDNTRYREYLRGDVDVTQALYRFLAQDGVSDYAWREMRVAAIGAAITQPGFRVDTELLAQRYANGEMRRLELINWLATEHGLPMADEKGQEYKAPHSTTSGKAALIEAFESMGVPESALPRTKPSKTHPNGAVSFSADSMMELASKYPGDGVQELTEAISGLAGVRTVYWTAMQHFKPTGRVHSDILMLQASGRWSTRKPGLTVFGKRGGRVTERAIFLPDHDDHVLVAFDLSQVDARAVAALAGDDAYLDMFLPGVDLHTETAKMVWGDEGRRDDAKPLNHGTNYGMAVAKLAATAGVSEADAAKFVRTRRQRFPRLHQWQDEVRELAKAGSLLDNGFGRLMRPNPAKYYTQGPALMGQGAARDIMMEGMLRLDDDVVRMIRAQVHDEIVLSIPKDQVDEVERHVVDCLTFEWAPNGASRPVQILADKSARGENWADVYHKG